jgi:hypothetical protein
VRVPFAVSLVALALAPVPALAEDMNDPALAEAAAQLSDPARQEQVGAMAQAMIGAMLQLPVGGMLRAAAEMAGEDAADIDPATTIADMAGPEAQQAPAEIAERLPQMMGAMATMVGALDTMLPQLRDMAETMRRELPSTR